METEHRDPITRLTETYPVVINVVVRWGDMDALGHVNNIIYHQYFESARIAYLERLGFTPPSPGSEAPGIILAANSCRYKAPVTYPDTLAIGARTSALSEDRFRMHYTAVSHKLHRVVAEGEALVVSYDYAARHRIPLPEAVREAIIALEGRELPPVSH